MPIQRLKIKANRLPSIPTSKLASGSSFLTSVSASDVTSNLPSGSVLNTVTAYHTTSTEISTSYTTYVNPSITPSSSSSKILVIVTICVDIIGDSNFTAVIKRSIGGTQSPLNPDIGSSFYGSGNFGSANQHGLCYAITTLDSPNTTSSIEYRLQLVESGRVLLSHSGDTSIVLMEIKG